MLTTAPTDTETGLLRAILDLPECDNARLVYCDWLEENAGEVECPRCKGHGWEHVNRGCNRCDGSGRVSDGRRERAEFIKVQVELAEPINCKGWGCRKCTSKAVKAPTYSEEDCGCRHKVRREALRQRERELWQPNARKWFGSAVENLITSGDPERMGLGGSTATVSRGFVSTVSAPLTAMVGGPCDNCGGTGLVDGDRWEQSEPCPDCGGEYGPSDEDNPRGVYAGTGRTPGIAADLIGCQPVTRWVATDKEIFARSWWRWSGRSSPAPSDIPADVWDLIEADEVINEAKVFHTKDPIAALSRAVATIAKKQGEK